MYSTQIEKSLGIQRRAIAFHLNALEKAGLVNSEFGLSKEDERTIPLTVRYYKLTSKDKEILRKLLDVIK
jgi:predicted transcriptional regulator